MAQNILIRCGSQGAAAFAARLAEASGDDLGLVNTRISPSELKPSGGRIEEERDYGGVEFSTFDEPLAVGSAVAQLAGHADAVVVDRLDDWAVRLVGHHGDDTRAITAEVTSIVSVMKAGLLDTVLLWDADGAAGTPGAELAARIIAEVEPLCDVIVDARGEGEPRVEKGALPV